MTFCHAMQLDAHRAAAWSGGRGGRKRDTARQHSRFERETRLGLRAMVAQRWVFCCRYSTGLQGVGRQQAALGARGRIGEHAPEPGQSPARFPGSRPPVQALGALIPGATQNGQHVNLPHSCSDRRVNRAQVSGSTDGACSRRPPRQLGVGTCPQPLIPKPNPNPWIHHQHKAQSHWHNAHSPRRASQKRRPSEPS